MDVLSRTRNITAWLLLLAWLAASACLSWPRTERAEPSFPHRVHVVDNQLACSMCHPSTRVADRPGMPPPELCAPCHDQFDPGKPADRRVGAFFDERGRYRTVAVSGRTDDVVFSHARHVDGSKLDCNTCHPDVATQDAVPLAPLATKRGCMDCHARSNASNACETCHREISPSWTPPSHARAWLRGHGDIARAGDDSSQHRCELCHQDATSCNACHQQMAPMDHNQTFRLRTHGLRASIDRSRCATCHTQASCEQCHSTTEPRSHRGGFGAPQQRHCVGCHFPLADEGCSTCHRSTPGHQLATPLPADHSTAMNCRLCHGGTAPLPHPDGGHACTVCHR